MNRTPAPRLASRGFGLLELLVSLLLVSVVLGGIMVAFFRSSSQAEQLTQVADRRQAARSGVQLIEREVRTAGSGWGRIPIYCNDSAGNPDTIQAVAPGYTSPAADDSLLLVGAWQASTTITNAMPNPSSILKVQDVTGFNSGDLVLITNGTSANMMQCTGTNVSSENIQHNPSSPYNAGTVSSWPSSGYGPGSIVCKLTIASYYMDRTSFRKPALMRHEYMQAPQVAAYNVDGFRVRYQLQDGTWTRNPQDMLQVTKVSPVVLTRISSSGRPALVDSVWSAVQPRTF